MASAEAESSFKICITVLEKKIRNLEKRKSKLDSYKGKEGTLDKDQQEAVTKYDSVLMNLDFARELHKHFNSLKSDCEKHSKKQTKKERLERQANDLAKTRNIFKLNKLCHLMRQSVVRTALQDGAVPQVSLETGQLEMLDKLFTLVCPSHDCTMEKLNSSSEHTFNLFEKFDKKFSEDSEYKYNQAYPLVERLCSENVLETLTSFVSGKPTSSEMMVTPTQGGGDNAGVTVTNEDEEEEEEEDGSKLRNDEDEDRKMVEKLGETFSEEEFRPNKTPSSSETVSKQFNTPPQAAVTEVQYNSPPTSIPYPPTHLEVTGEDKEAWKEQQFHHNNHYTYHPPTESRPLHDIVSSVQGHYNFLQESHIEQQQQQTRQEDRQQQRLVATTAHTSPNLHMQFVVKDSNNNNSNSTVMSESFYHHHHHHHHHHLPQHLQQPPLLQSQQIHHHHQQQQLLLQQQQASQKLEQPLNQSSASNVTNENNSSIDLITYQQHNYYQQQQRHMALNDIYSVNGQGQTSSDRSSQEPPEQLPSSNYIYQQDQLQTHDQGEAGKMASETTNNNTSNYQQQQQLYHQQRNQLSKSAMNPNANVFQSTNRSEASINQSSASSQLPINAAKNNGSNDEAKGTSNPSAAVKELNNNVNYPNGKVNDNKSYNKYDDKNKGGHQGAKGGGAYNQQHYNNNRYNNQSRPSFNRQGQMSAYRQMGGRYVGGSAVRSSGNYGYYNNNNNYNSAGGNGNYSASGKSPATVATAN